MDFSESISNKLAHVSNRLSRIVSRDEKQTINAEDLNEYLMIKKANKTHPNGDFDTYANHNKQKKDTHYKSFNADTALLHMT